MAISLRAARSTVVGDVSLQGDPLVYQGSSNTYTITDYNSFSVYTVDADYGTASIVDDTITLDVPTPSTQPQIALTIIKDGKPTTFVVAVGTSVVNKPSIISPANGATGITQSPTLEGSVFASSPAGDSHVSSEWQIALDSGFANIVFNSGVTTTNKTTITASGLNIGTIYYARVRYTGSSYGTSEWSSTVSFTTSTIYIATPTITIPDAPSNVGETPTVTTSAFTVVGGSDTHSSTDWQIVKTSDNSIVYQNLGSTANKVSLSVPPNILDESTQYKMRVRYNGATHGSSAWAESTFTTRAEFFVFDSSFAGQPFGGGYYAGANIVIGGNTYALVVAPASLGGQNTTGLTWKTSNTQTSGTSSLNDGAANTQAMVNAGISSHPAAQFCKNLTIGGFNDWYLPSVDELEICYRYLKPDTTANYVNASNGPNGAQGYNPSSDPVGAAYTTGVPARTSVSAFITGGGEAFSVSNYYWTSTEYAPNPADTAWVQAFNLGYQLSRNKTNTFCVRGVRRVLIS